MAADRRERDATPDAAGGGAGPEELIRTTGDPASGALVVLRSGPPGEHGSGPPSSGAGPAPDLAGLEEEALDRFEIRVCRLRAAREGGDDGVVVTAVVRAPHRRAAFAAARWALAAALDRPGAPGPAAGDP